nr:ABC transporter [Zoogloeaceae bacterium]
LLIARESLGFGQTTAVLSAENLARARVLARTFDENAPVCQRHVAEELA